LAITYHAGRRIQGTSTDATAVSGGWKEIGRTTLGSAGATIDVSSLPDKQYYMTLFSGTRASGNDVSYRYNGDTVSNYAGREVYNGGSENEYSDQNHNRVFGGGTMNFDVQYIANIADKEKLMIGHGTHSSTGNSAIPTRVQRAQKWDDRSESIDEVNLFNLSAGNFNTDAEVVVLGYDPDDTHTDNFWEELASVDLSGGTATSLSSGTFTSKKYLMVQWFCERSGSGDIQPVLQVGTGGSIDNGQNYPMRLSHNGGTDFTSSSYRGYSVWGSSNQRFETMFIINNSANEKLCISHGAGNNSAGGNVAPDRTEYVGKWTNTSGQINIVSLKDQDGITLGTATQMKVWGHD
jgi:hypothetical protein